MPGDTTDAEGRFAGGVATGSTHTLTASHEGRYALARVTPGPALPEVVLELGSALQVEGTVADEAGRPVADATVKVNPLGMAYPTLRAVTDAKGRYRVGPVEPGEWSFLAEAPGHLDMVRSDYHTLGPATGPVDLTLTRAASVTGRVTDVEGQPLRDIRLSLALPSAAEASKRALPRENAWTDAEGRFVIDAEEAGDYLLRVTDAPYLDVSVPVRAPSGAVHLTLEAGASVEGTLADARGLRLEGFRVELQDPEGKEELSLGRRASTDTKGHFLLQGVAPGRYVLVASRNALSAARRAWREVELRAGTRTQVELRMEPERTLPGIVVDDAGQPLKDVHIRARPPQRDGPVWKQDWRHLGHHGAPLGIKTGPDGRFVLEGLTEPTYDVSASVRGYTFAPGRSTGGLGEQEQGLLRVGADTAQVRLVMARDAHLIGRVVGPEGAPIPRFDVNGYPMEDASGAFSVPARDTGSQSLVFRAEGLALRVLQLEPHTGPGDQDVGVVRMSRGRGLQGQVVDAVTGEPLADASLDLVSRAMDGHGNPVSQASRSTDEDGTFDWPHLDLEAFTLTVSLEGYQAQRLTVGPEQETVTVRLDPGARVEVTVKDLKGRPRDATVEFHGDDGTFASEVAVRGALVQRGLKPGPYTVRLMPEDSMDQRFPTFLPQRVVVPATGRVQVSFRAREGGATVRLRVPDDFRSDALLLPRSVPLPARREDLERLVAQSVPSKAVGDETVFHHVPPGRATILVIHPDGPTQFHSEELEVPAGDTLSRVLSPVWRAFGTAADPQVAEERGGGEGEADARGQQ
ncbi:carboxypeptidase regulatory-like domain-containing protein [Pyxidicoccus sp. 3LFB2]